MVEIIPSINEEIFEEISRKIRLVEPYVKWAHIDVSDGTFTGHSSWHNPEALLAFETKLNLEIHLMIADMDTHYGDWILPNVSRVIFHIEAARDPHFVIEKIHTAGKEAGAAIRPETEWQKLEPFCAAADMVQLLAVPPGRAGQEFRPETVEKVANIRRLHPGCIIEVDGGINPDTGRRCVAAGANILVSANYVFNSPDIGGAIQELGN
ncbi:MAG: ribulose-phosphate 3-epimerase [Patescibacteria group bacterium]